MKLIISLLIIISFTLEAQVFTEKYNIQLQRIEYYDLTGKIVGFSKENAKYNLIEYYDSSGVLVKSYKQSELLFSKFGLGVDSTIVGIKRWNFLRKRYEVFDSLGSVIGHYEYDNLSRKWNYYFGR